MLDAELLVRRVDELGEAGGVGHLDVDAPARRELVAHPLQRGIEVADVLEHADQDDHSGGSGEGKIFRERAGAGGNAVEPLDRFRRVRRGVDALQAGQSAIAQASEKSACRAADLHDRARLVGHEPRDQVGDVAEPRPILLRLPPAALGVIVLGKVAVVRVERLLRRQPVGIAATARAADDDFVTGEQATGDLREPLGEDRPRVDRGAGRARSPRQRLETAHARSRAGGTA